MKDQKKFFITFSVVAVVLIVAFVVWKMGSPGVDYTQKGIVAYRAGNFVEAKADFTKAISSNTNVATAYFFLGRVALGREDPGGKLLYPDADYVRAITNYEKAMALGVKDKNRDYYVQGLNDLGFAYWMSKNYTKADENFVARIAVAPETAYVSRYLLASDYFSRFNKPKEALDLLLAESDSKVSAEFKAAHDFKVYTLMARLYSYFKDSANAEKYTKLAIESGGVGNKDIDIQIAHIILASVQAQKGNLSAAEGEIKIINDLAGSPMGQACGVSSVYVLGKNYQKAIALALTASSGKNYSYSICLRTLADASLALDNKFDAKKYYMDYIQVAGALAEKNIFVVRGLAEVNEALKNL